MNAQVDLITANGALGEIANKLAMSGRLDIGRIVLYRAGRPNLCIRICGCRPKRMPIGTADVRLPSHRDDGATGFVLG